MTVIDLKPVIPKIFSTLIDQVVTFPSWQESKQLLGEKKKNNNNNMLFVNHDR